MKKRKIIPLMLVLFLALTPLTARAETFYGGSDWNVTFTPEAAMVSSFKTQDMDDVINGLQPGDNAIITLVLRNDHDTETNWYMTNKVLHSLEDRSTNKDTYGGAYTYILTYTDPSGTETILFNSDTVGGENSDDDNAAAGEGLHEATDALEEFFYLDTLAKGQSGTIRLEVALDGETQGNDYQDTLADLQMNFAVELNTAPAVTPEPAQPQPSSDRRTETRNDEIVYLRPVKTGDDAMSIGFLAVMMGGGALLLGLAVYSLYRNRRSRKEG